MFTVIISLSLIACQEEISLADAMDQIEITFAEGDSFESVTTDITLTQTLVGFDDVKLVWTSSHPEIMDIYGTVNRPAQTTEVTLTVKLTYESRQRRKDFVFTVISRDIDNPDKGSYQLEVYFENIENDAYTLKSTQTIIADLGTEVTVTATYTGFVINAELSDLTAIVVEEEITIKHYYDRLTYEIIFMNEEDEVGNQIIKYEEDIIFPDDLLKEGYKLSGWTTDSEGLTLFNPNQDITEDYILYAKWNIITYLIDYEVDGGINHISNPSDYTIEVSTITLGNPSREGHTFGGWYSDVTHTDQVTEIPSGSTGDLTLYAKWTINNYTIAFDSNDGTDVSSITQDYGTVVTEPIKPTKEGYTFRGWYSDIALTTTYKFTTMPAQNITLYAKWTFGEASLEDLNYSGYGNYYLSLNESNNVINDLALLLRDTIDYVSYGDARYIYAKYDNDSQVIMYDVPSSPSYRKVPATGTAGWGTGGVISTPDFSITINREHIWACSDMRIMPVNKSRSLTSYVEFVINDGSFDYRPSNTNRGHFSDLHNLWNALAGPNQTHSDHFYGEENGPSVASYLSNSIFYPGDEYRGDVARALFYMTLMYPHLTLVERDDPNANEGTIYYGYLEDLLRWNEEDPVSYYELERNNTIFSAQGNRNPFIDFYDQGFADLLFAEGDPNVLD